MEDTIQSQPQQPRTWVITKREQAFLAPRMKQIEKLLQEVKWLTGLVEERLGVPENSLEPDLTTGVWKEIE